MEMIKKLIAIFLLLASLTASIGCQTTGRSTSITDDAKALQKSPKGPVGKLKFEVAKGVDLTDIINGSVANAEKETIYGYLTVPDNFEGKIPAVIIMHASGGVFSWREKSMAKILNSEGIAAFIPHSFAARGLHKTKSTQETGTTFGMRVADAFAALEFLSNHPNIDKNRIGVMGYSSGGFASLLSIDKKVRNNIINKDMKFASHVNVYASPILVFKEPHPTDAPMLFLMGGKDDACPKDKVLELAKAISNAGGDITTKIYPDAYHVFDSNSSVKKLKMDNDGSCQFKILNNGNLVDAVSGEQFPEREIYANNNAHIKPCMTNSVTFGRNNFAAKHYKIDALEFFVKTLKP
jgi:dienelactone hydrolase